MARVLITGFFVVLLIAAGFAFFFYQRKFEVNPQAVNVVDGNLAAKVAVKEPEPLPPPQPLGIPPSTIKAIYATNWSAGTPSKLNYLLGLIAGTELNAIVIDIKDYSGFVGYDTGLAEVKDYKAEEIRIEDIDSLVRKLHEREIYAIARVTVFQDPRLALARPDLAVKDSRTGEVWRDNKGLSWMDPGSKIVWDYNIGIIRNILSHGFDEINLDYIRFPSDGNLDVLQYPFWDGVTPKREVIAAFYRYLRKELPEAKLSADLFGQSTVNDNDLGIGQVIEDAYESFDYVSPMVYPSHYISSFLNLGNPTAHPYEVVKYSMDKAFERLRNWQLVNSSLSNSTSSPVTNYQLPVTKLRPWLQAFDLGAVYSPEMVQREIQAVYDAASSTPELLNGFMLWNAGNVYDRRALPR